MRVLTIYCPECGEKAMIKKSNRKHKELTDLYCACRDPLCGHTFVLNLTFSHTLSPSAKKQDALLFAMIKNLSPQQREKALTLLQEI
ncbi:MULTISPECIES: ogr/Delta-like zinc finger family protein [Proteus]|uniref:ogr/Delta-like zinc finger family protein n=1 Tax=Proteus TaxID=583 RepID=UPI0002E61168|nr:MULTISPECIES: ogr/Delta-like zinc finger family protein [Proteus]ALE23237.1 transcriptional regulator [Proteus mirabilis]ALE26400.1 transcriptional regulator [Proteus mirabilis]AND11841.1 transcriptional regulator [Proteus mirabilis]EHZ6746410.1 ogr/Delta-like zinc finger family protein [Proteus mirabilis]EKT8251027.1 ogr/Delta-like zinc finger family protein [Proteus mirabilis]